MRKTPAISILAVVVAATAAILSPLAPAATNPGCADRCRAASPPRLTADRARVVFHRQGAKQAGGPVRIALLDRISGRSFFGTARWFELSSDADGQQLTEACFVLMQARLGKDERVFVSTIESGCSPVPAPPPPKTHL